MNTLAWILGFIIFSFVFTLLVGRFMRAGAGPHDPRPDYDAMVAAHNAMMRAQDELNDELNAEIVERLAENRAELKRLYTLPWSVKIVGERARLYDEIREDEEVLRTHQQFGAGRRVLPESYDWL